MRPCLRILTRFVCLITGITGFAQDGSKSESPAAEEAPADIRAGHSEHGLAFNDGPRQKAYFMQGMPDVQFAVTTKVPECQKFFNQGIGQLHGFWN